MEACQQGLLASRREMDESARLFALYTEVSRTPRPEAALLTRRVSLWLLALYTEVSRRARGARASSIEKEAVVLGRGRCWSTAGRNVEMRR